MTTDIPAPPLATRPTAPAGRPSPHALRRLGGGVGTVLLCLGTLLFVLPFLFTVVTSLRTAADVARSPLGIPHSLTFLIELQAYVLFLLGAFLVVKYWLFPRTAGAENRRQGYLRGLRQLGLLALPALVLLIIGALWEAYSLRYLVHPLAQLLL
jgi:ABC-type glycerol-3-phosphate transport system permease component